MARSIAIFQGTKPGSKVILVGLKDKKGVNFIVEVNTNVPVGWKHFHMNHVANIYPKNNINGIVKWINRGDMLLRVNKEKALSWITQKLPRATYLEIREQDLHLAANIIKNFKKPPLNEGNLINNNQYRQPETLADGQKLFTLSPRDAPAGQRICRAGLAYEGGGPGDAGLLAEDV